MSYQTRKLPKKTLITIFGLIVLGIIFLFTLQTLKIDKYYEVLATLNHKNISNLKVVSKQTVEDVDTKLKSAMYKVVFYDNDLNKKCIGFIYRDRLGEYMKDIDCK